MSGFKTKVQLELGDDGLWYLLAPLVWEGSDGDAVTVPRGAWTDFATVPSWLQSIIPAAAIWIVRAAIVHDELCRELQRYELEMQRYQRAVEHLPGSMWPPKPVKPAFSSVDADAVFEKIMRDEGASWLAQRVGWTGVRLGAAWSSYRRQGWLRTAPRVIGLSVAFLAVALGGLALIGWVLPW